MWSASLGSVSQGVTVYVLKKIKIRILLGFSPWRHNLHMEMWTRLKMLKQRQKYEALVLTVHTVLCISRCLDNAVSETFPVNFNRKYALVFRSDKTYSIYTLVHKARVTNPCSLITYQKTYLPFRLAKVKIAC